MSVAQLSPAAIAFCALLAVPAVGVQAQLARYEFTGTRVSGSPELGDTVAGTVVLDTAAVPYINNDQVKFWRDGAFSVDAVTDAGFVGGTQTWSYRTLVFNIDQPEVPLVLTGIYAQYQEYSDDGDVFQSSLYLFSESATAGDGLTSVPDPWDPLAAERQGVTIGWDRSSTGESYSAFYRIDTFTLVSSNLFIDGQDTGIEDFTYQGQLVSVLLEACAAGAGNHGQYVSRVAHLTNDLKKAGLLTSQQKAAIQTLAAQSSIGE
jgi:hypothetical protein